MLDLRDTHSVSSLIRRAASQSKGAGLANGGSQGARLECMDKSPMGHLQQKENFAKGHKDCWVLASHQGESALRCTMGLARDVGTDIQGEIL